MDDVRVPRDTPWGDVAVLLDWLSWQSLMWFLVLTIVAFGQERYLANGMTMMVASPRMRSLSKALIFSLTVSVFVSVTATLMISPGMDIERRKEKSKCLLLYSLQDLVGWHVAYSKCQTKLVQVLVKSTQCLGCSCAMIVDKHTEWCGVGNRGSSS